MAIFNSYVKLPEGKHKQILSKRGKWCLTLRINQFGRAYIFFGRVGGLQLYDNPVLYMEYPQLYMGH